MRILIFHDYWKNHRLTIRTFISKVVSLLLKILSSFVTYFLPRSKHPWLWSPSTVILEPKKNSLTVFISPPIICHEVMGLDDMILVFECWILSQFFSLYFCTFIKSLFSSSSLSTIRVESSVYEVIDIYPGNLDFNLGFIQSGIFHDVLCI